MFGWRRSFIRDVAQVATLKRGELRSAPDTGVDLVVRTGAAQRTGHGGPGNAECRRVPGFGVLAASSNRCRRSRTGGYSMGVVGAAVSRRQGRTPTGLQDALERLCRSGP